MSPFFQKPLKRLLITGANGWVGRNAYQALKNDFTLILVDNKQGEDTNNRFGLEKADKNSLELPENCLQSINLASDKDSFEKLIQNEKPDIVLHFAGILENQPIEKIKENNKINKNVLSVCAKNGVKLIAMSSIMVMYGKAISESKILSIFKREPLVLTTEEKLTVNSPLQNTEETIKAFDENHWQNILAYIKSKEKLEEFAKNLINENPTLTFALIRSGWTGIKNPYELEKENKRKMTETPVYLEQKDLQNFIFCLVNALLTEKITGYKLYISVSNHPQSWVNIENTIQDLGWKPKANIQENARMALK